MDDWPLNWTEDERGVDMAHTLLEAEAEFAALTPAEDWQLYRELRDFVHFKPGPHQTALVTGRVDSNGHQYLFFSTGRNFFGFASFLVNGPVVPVRVWCDDHAKLVVGDTAGNHMLIGQRRWTVVAETPTKRVWRTEAYERPSWWMNSFGMRAMGRRRQQQIWSTYFSRILSSLKNTTRTALRPQPEVKREPSPWEPRQPCPRFSGRI